MTLALKWKDNQTFKEIIKIALPIASESMLISLIQLIDNLFIGALNNSELAANGINAVANMSFIISTVVTGFIGGVGVMFAKQSGANNVDGLKSLFRAKILYAVIISAIMITIAVLFLRSIAGLWISKEDTAQFNGSVDFAYDYGSIIFPTMFIDFIIISISSSFKEKKMIKVPVILAIIAIAINASLNYPLMFIANMGIKGSAYATLISKISLLLFWIIYLVKTKPNFIMKFTDFFKLKNPIIFKIFPKVAIWTLNALLVNLAFTLQMLFYSNSSIEAGASLIVAGAIASLISALMIGYTQAISILVMHHIGQGTKDINTYVSKLLRQSVAVGVVLGLILASISFLPIYLYPHHSYTTRIQAMLMINAIASAIWINLIISTINAHLKGMNYKWTIILVDALISWMITLPLTYVLTRYTSIDIGYIYWIVTATVIFKGIASFAIWKNITKGIKKH